MNFQFFRKNGHGEADSLYLPPLTLYASEDVDVEQMEWTQVQPTIAENTSTDASTLAKAEYGRIALVGIGNNDVFVSTLLAGASIPQLLKIIILPQNPRSASHQLYEIDAMDMIIMLVQQSLTREAVRWLRRLKYLRVPMIVLVYQPEQNRSREKKYQQFSEQTGVPIILFETEKPDVSRQLLLEATLQVHPEMAVALAANIDLFRPMLIDTIISQSVKLSLLDDAPMQAIQEQLVYQISVAYGCSGQSLKQAQTGLDAMMHAVNHYTNALTSFIRIKDVKRRARFKQAVSTLMVGYTTRVHHGAPSPSIRKDILPQIWRLYRASRQSV